jgi:hypothetical protein
MIRNEILEYPYSGTIKRVIQGKGSNPDTEETLYEGVMDEHMVTDEEGRTLQTSSYIISIPLTMSVPTKEGEVATPIIPRKGDKISLTRYGETFKLTVDNADPSQLGGVSIYATRNSW